MSRQLWGYLANKSYQIEIIKKERRRSLNLPPSAALANMKLNDKSGSCGGNSWPIFSWVIFVVLYDMSDK